MDVPDGDIVKRFVVSGAYRDLAGVLDTEQYYDIGNDPSATAEACLETQDRRVDSIAATIGSTTKLLEQGCSSDGYLASAEQRATFWRLWVQLKAFRAAVYP